MKSLRALVLMHESLVPPDNIEGYSDSEILEWKTEYDVVTSLKEMGHNVLPLGVSDDLGQIRRAIIEWNPHIAFNLLEEFHGVGVYDHHVVGYLELMRQHYTGCNPRGLLLAHDKSLAKKILSFHRIRTPRFSVVAKGKKTKRPRGVDYPLLVKSALEDASLGISQSSIVHDDDQLEKRVTYIHDELSTDAMVERFIEGRELYVGVMGNRRLTTLPIWEMHFHNAPPEMPQIADSRPKWDTGYQKQMGIETCEAATLDPAVTKKINSICKRVYRALSLSGYARMDLRLTDDNEIFVLEANPNPNLSYGEDFAESAEAFGISYEKLLQKIINLGLNYQAEWRLV